MKLLLDENLSHKLVPRLAAAFPETVHVDGVGLHGQPDSAVWQYAAEHSFVVVSKDDDFRQLSFLRGHPPKVVWLVVGNVGTAVIADLLQRNQARALRRSRPTLTMRCSRWPRAGKMRSNPAMHLAKRARRPRAGSVWVGPLCR